MVRSLITVALLLVPLMLMASAAQAQPEPSLAEMQLDAELTAVTFVDADRGWAVGDRGVIWHTVDGGRTWKLQPSGVTCRLEAVQFLDADNGFAVGGWVQPYTHSTHGVALRTRDGGRTWQNTPDLTLPCLRHVRFFDGRQGLALGEASALYPSGVLRSEDGGRSWASITKGETTGWTTGDFRSLKYGVVAGYDEQTAAVTPTEVKPANTSNIGSRPARRMLLAGNNSGWLLGDGGLVLTTTDDGLTWSPASGSLPEAAARSFDFRALAVRGSHVWIAGAPGTCVFHSPDAGQSWQTFNTDQTAPLRGLWFLDEYRGWAVGSLGTILHTRDGGRSWRVQQSGATRAALLGVFSDPSRVPLEIVAAQASEAYITAVEIVGRVTDRPGHASLISDRTHAAVVASGGSAADSAWQFPLPEPGLFLSADAIVERWNRTTEGKALERLEEHLVRRIRQWRPEVIVTEDATPRGDNPLAFITNQVTLAAAAKAGDASAYPEQIAIGLAAWKTKKVLGVIAGGKVGAVNITPAQWSPLLGKSIAEQAETARGLILDDIIATPRTIGLSLLVDRMPQNSGKRDLMSGVAMQPGSEARRLRSSPTDANLESLHRLAIKRHNVEQLLEGISADTTVGSGWLGQIGDLVSGFSATAAGDILWQLGRRYQAVGKLSHAAEAFQALLTKYPQHPLADAAAVWLVQYYGSSEVAWRERKETRTAERLATAAGDPSAKRAIKATAELPIPPLTFGATVSYQSPVVDLNPVERAGRALGVAKPLEQSRPSLYAEPALRFVVAAASRQAGQARVGDRFLQSLASSPSDSIWPKNAAAEQWINHPTDKSPKPVCSAVTAIAKPKLDGRLDDTLWQVTKPTALTGREGEGSYPAAAVLAFDAEYLYIALSCRKAPGVDYAAAGAPRTADSDLCRRDRVTILLDIDRDYATYWSLTIDHRGWPAESCFGDSTWNPQWFIAASGDADHWTAEAAIPLQELAARKPQYGDVWTIGVQRIIPGIGVAAFTHPAGVEPRPESFALLVFE